MVLYRVRRVNGDPSGKGDFLYSYDSGVLGNESNKRATAVRAVDSEEEVLRFFNQMSCVVVEREES